jgi:hypothetical protein
VLACFFSFAFLKFWWYSADVGSAMSDFDQVVSDRRVARLSGRASTCEPWGRRDGQMNRESLAPTERRAANRVERRRARRDLREALAEVEA